MNQNNNPDILQEKDYRIVLYDDKNQRQPVSSQFIRNFTASFDKKGLTLSVYLTDLTEPIDIRALQEASTLEVQYCRNIAGKAALEPICHKFEILDIVGSTQGNSNSEKPLSYAIQFLLK